VDRTNTHDSAKIPFKPLGVIRSHVSLQGKDLIIFFVLFPSFIGWKEDHTTGIGFVSIRSAAFILVEYSFQRHPTNLKGGICTCTTIKIFHLIDWEWTWTSNNLSLN
jgi:hypothetical protein